MKTTTFKIEGMHCDGCANTIKGLIEKEPGVQMAAVSFTDGQARVLYDPQATREDCLVVAIEKPGYRVTSRQ
ncbi:MAG: heavy-metal-associated domain-containing protein [Candidatus Rokubacteria bacterium]|nr:heavy-metal-associated domain-containing protein [Candidatus Rokubacteria bacterium]